MRGLEMEIIEELKICRQVLTSSTQLQLTSLIGRERLRNVLKEKRAKRAKLWWMIVKCANL